MEQHIVQASSPAREDKAQIGTKRSPVNTDPIKQPTTFQNSYPWLHFMSAPHLPWARRWMLPPLQFERSEARRKPLNSPNCRLHFIFSGTETSKSFGCKRIRIYAPEDFFQQRFFYTPSFAHSAIQNLSNKQKTHCQNKIIVQKHLWRALLLLLKAPQIHNTLVHLYNFS